jgi:hypothetical protein
MGLRSWGSVLILAAVAASGRAADERSNEVLARAREALGGAARIEKVASLSASGEMRRVISGPDGGEPQEMSGEVTLDLLLPDSYLRVESLSPIPGAPPLSMGFGLDAGEPWAAPIGGGGPGIVFRRREEGNQPGGGLAKTLRGEMGRLLLALLASTSPAIPLDLTYVGEAEAPDGRAHAVDATGPDGFAARVYFAVLNQRPLMISYREPARRMMVMRVAGPRPPAGSAPPPDLKPAGEPAPLAEVQLFLDDYRAVDGILLPHRIAKSIDGKPSEEWTITRFKVNPALAREKFKKKG